MKLAIETIIVEETISLGIKLSEKLGYFLISLHTLKVLYATSRFSPCWPLEM